MLIASLTCQTLLVSQVPAAHRTLEVLLLLARSAGPIPAATMARELEIPKSSLYHLLAAMQSKGFVTSITAVPKENSLWGLGVSAFEVGSAYVRHEPLEARARPVLIALLNRVGGLAPLVGHLGILRGSDTYYLLKESSGGPITVVSEIGVRLPASLTASGRAMLSYMSAAQIRALFPNVEAFVDRTGKGPLTPKQLKALLVTERKWIDFITYSGGLPMMTVRVFPDFEIQDAIIAAATAFEKRLAEAHERYLETLETCYKKAYNH